MYRYIVSGVWENGSLYVQIHGSPAAHNHRDISSCNCVFETSLYGWLVGMEKVRQTGIVCLTPRIGVVILIIRCCGL